MAELVAVALADLDVDIHDRRGQGLAIDAVFARSEGHNGEVVGDGNRI